VRACRGGNTTGWVQNSWARVAVACIRAGLIPFASPHANAAFFRIAAKPHCRLLPRSARLWSSTRLHLRPHCTRSNTHGRGKASAGAAAVRGQVEPARFRCESNEQGPREWPARQTRKIQRENMKLPNARVRTALSPSALGAAGEHALPPPTKHGRPGFFTDCGIEKNKKHKFARRVSTNRSTKTA